MPEAVIIDAVRTPRGRRKGGFRDVHPMDLSVEVLNALTKRNDFDPVIVEDVILGCVTQIREQGSNIARAAVLAAGWPIEVSGNTVNRFCASGLQAVNYGAQAIMSGQTDVMVAGGVESMTRVQMGSDVGPPSTKLTKRFNLVPQHFSADMIANKYKISREECDEFAYKSQMNCKQAVEEGRFDKSLIPVEGKDADGNKITVEKDEHPRPSSTLEALAGLKATLGQDTSVHSAGSSSGIVDGASAVLITSKEKARELGLKPRAKFVSMGLGGSDPILMLEGPIPSTKDALKKAKMTIDDIDLIEINEAFAVVPIRCGRELGMDFDKVNVNGGAIALGHPLGSTGAMLIGTVLDELERQDKTIGLITLCIGYGMGVTTIISRDV